MLISSEQNDPHQILLSRGFVWLFKTYIRVFKWRDKVCECYNCLKMMIQAHLHVGFFTILFIKRASLEWFYIYIWNCCQQAQFLNKTIIMKCLESKVIAWNFLLFFCFLFFPLLKLIGSHGNIQAMNSVTTYSTFKYKRPLKLF